MNRREHALWAPRLTVLPDLRHAAMEPADDRREHPQTPPHYLLGQMAPHWSLG